MPYNPGIVYNGNQALYQGGLQFGQNIKELIGFLIGQSQEKKTNAAFGQAMSMMTGGDGGASVPASQPNAGAMTANPMEAQAANADDQVKRQGNVIDGVRKVATEFFGKDRAKHIGAAETRGILQAMTMGMQMQEAQRKSDQEAQTAQYHKALIDQMTGAAADKARQHVGEQKFWEGYLKPRTMPAGLQTQMLNADGTPATTPLQPGPPSAQERMMQGIQAEIAAGGVPDKSIAHLMMGQEAGEAVDSTPSTFTGPNGEVLFFQPKTKNPAVVSPFTKSQAHMEERLQALEDAIKLKQTPPPPRAVAPPGAKPVSINGSDYLEGEDGTLYPAVKKTDKALALQVFTGKGPNGAPAAAAPAKKEAVGGYTIGTVYAGLKYLGGDPKDQANWEKVR